MLNFRSYPNLTGIVIPNIIQLSTGNINNTFNYKSVLLIEG